MNINEMVSSGNSLKSEDIKGRGDQRVIIEDVSSREFETDKGKVRKGIISFRGKQKVLVCNMLNANLIAEIYGPETDNWIGKEITLYVDRVQFGNKIVDGIRVRLPDRVPNPKPATYSKADTTAHHNETNPPPADDMDVPF